MDIRKFYASGGGVELSCEPTGEQANLPPSCFPEHIADAFLTAVNYAPTTIYQDRPLKVRINFSPITH